MSRVGYQLARPGQMSVNGIASQFPTGVRECRRPVQESRRVAAGMLRARAGRDLAGVIQKSGVVLARYSKRCAVQSPASVWTAESGAKGCSAGVMPERHSDVAGEMKVRATGRPLSCLGPRFGDSQGRRAGQSRPLVCGVPRRRVGEDHSHMERRRTSLLTLGGNARGLELASLMR
jgi:hypothetical protein